MLTQAELLHLRECIGDWQYWIEQYPETVGEEEEERLAIAKEIINANLAFRYRDDS